MPTVFFITHPDVAIDPAVAVPDWPLNGRGQERMRAITGWSWARNVRRIFEAEPGRENFCAVTRFALAVALPDWVAARW